MTSPKPRRCAIYTRKSSEEGLEQDFNSIQAQLAELRVVAAQVPRKVTELVRRLSDPDDIALPPFAWAALLSLRAQLEALAAEIGRIESGV